MTLHVKDSGFWQVVAQGGLVDWASITAIEAKLHRPEQSVLSVSALDLQLDKTPGAVPRVLWRPDVGALPKAGLYTLQVRDVTGGRSQMLVSATFRVLPSLF